MATRKDGYVAIVRSATAHFDFVGECQDVRPSFVVTDEPVKIGRASEHAAQGRASRLQLRASLPRRAAPYATPPHDAPTRR